jgi:hypothetical protein
MCAGSSKVRYLKARRVGQEMTERRIMDVQVLQDLGEPEALHVVDEAAVRVIDVVQGSERNGRGEELVERLDGAGRTVKVLLVARDSPCVEVGFQNWGGI